MQTSQKFFPFPSRVELKITNYLAEYCLCSNVRYKRMSKRLQHLQCLRPTTNHFKSTSIVFSQFRFHKLAMQKTFSSHDISGFTCRYCALRNTSPIIDSRANNNTHRAPPPETLGGDRQQPRNHAPPKDALRIYRKSRLSSSWVRPCLEVQGSRTSRKPPRRARAKQRTAADATHERPRPLPPNTAKLLTKAARIIILSRGRWRYARWGLSRFSRRTGSLELQKIQQRLIKGGGCGVPRGAKLRNFGCWHEVKQKQYFLFFIVACAN